MGKYFSTTARHAKAREFLELKQERYGPYGGIRRLESVGPRTKVPLQNEDFAYILKRRDFTEGQKERIWGKSRVVG